MAGRRDDDEATTAAYASPPCLMHALDAEGRLSSVDARQRADVMRWRKAERERLIACRLAIPAAERRRCSEKIAAALDAALGDVSGLTIGVYSPFRGEPDLRDWVDRLRARGATVCLPVVVQPRTPLVFRAWHADTRLVPGIWNIPVPADGPAMVPDIVIAPVVGFDRDAWRLGHGGGYYDRTLASMRSRPRVVGVGYAKVAIPTIYPQPHDIPMDLIVTESGIAARRDAAR